MASKYAAFVPMPGRAVTKDCPPEVSPRYRAITVKMRANRRVRMSEHPLASVSTTDTPEGIVREMWKSCETAKFTSWLKFFSDSAVYHDTLYTQPFVGKKSIGTHLYNMETAIPASIVFKLDDIAAGADRVGARWHAETQDGAAIPFSRGASMYSFQRMDESLVITEAWDFVETPLKVAGVVLPILRGASQFLKWFGRDGRSKNIAEK